jgi:hypothetical protein
MVNPAIMENFPVGWLLIGNWSLMLWFRGRPWFRLRLLRKIGSMATIVALLDGAVNMKLPAPPDGSPYFRFSNTDRRFNRRST